MSLDDEIFCLINSLLSFPAITKYFEKIINTLLLYMEVVDVYSEKTRELILKMFIRMLSDYQQDFMIFFPYILKFMKNIGIKTVSYFDPFRVGIEKVPIMSVLTQNSKYKNILKSLPAAGYMEQREENTINNYGSNSPMKIKNKNESVSNLQNSNNKTKKSCIEIKKSLNNNKKDKEKLENENKNLINESNNLKNNIKNIEEKYKNLINENKNLKNENNNLINENNYLKNLSKDKLFEINDFFNDCFINNNLLITYDFNINENYNYDYDNYTYITKGIIIK